MAKTKQPVAAQANPCPPKAKLSQRPPMNLEQARAVEEVFEVLANDTRLRILQEIATKVEATTQEIAESLGMKPQAISNQLQRLQDKKIVIGRRVGNHVFYRVLDQCTIVLLERGICMVEEDAKRVNPPASRL